MKTCLWSLGSAHENYWRPMKTSSILIVSISPGGKKPSVNHFKISFFTVHIFWSLSSRHLLFQTQQWKHHITVWNLFKVNYNYARTASMTSFWSFYCYLWEDIPHFSGVSIAVIEHVNPGWVKQKFLQLNNKRVDWN